MNTKSNEKVTNKKDLPEICHKLILNNKQNGKKKKETNKKSPNKVVKKANLINPTKSLIEEFIDKKLETVKSMVTNNEPKVEIIIKNENSKEKREENKEQSKELYESLHIYYKNILKKRFMNNEKMSKGKLVEMVFGNKIPTLGHNEHNTFINQIIENEPKYILKIIKNEEINSEEVNDFYNLKQLKIKWNSKHETLFRNLCSKRAFKLVSLRNTQFLFESGYSKIMKTNFIIKHHYDKDNYDVEKLIEVDKIFTEIKKISSEKGFTFSSLNLLTFVEKKEFLLNQIINKSRKKFYVKNINNYHKNQENEKQMQIEDLLDDILHISVNNNKRIRNRSFTYNRCETSYYKSNNDFSPLTRKYKDYQTTKINSKIYANFSIKNMDISSII